MCNYPLVSQALTPFPQSLPTPFQLQFILEQPQTSSTRYYCDNFPSPARFLLNDFRFDCVLSETIFSVHQLLNVFGAPDDAVARPQACEPPYVV
jgi:hypothetical protein